MRLAGDFEARLKTSIIIITIMFIMIIIIINIYVYIYIYIYIHTYIQTERNLRATRASYLSNTASFVL